MFFVKQKTAYEMRISDWSSDVCSSDLPREVARLELQLDFLVEQVDPLPRHEVELDAGFFLEVGLTRRTAAGHARAGIGQAQSLLRQPVLILEPDLEVDQMVRLAGRSEEHTSELHSLMRTSYAAF